MQQYAFIAIDERQRRFAACSRGEAGIEREMI